jgi:hypothetical protein
MQKEYAKCRNPLFGPVMERSRTPSVRSFSSVLLYVHKEGRLGNSLTR